MSEPRWLLCELEETLVDVDEPDWSRVPADRRVAVRQRWQDSNARRVVSRVQLWSDQIPFFARQYTVRILWGDNSISRTFQQTSARE